MDFLCAVGSLDLKVGESDARNALPEVHRMPDLNVKEEAHRLIDNLSEQATWDDLMYRIYARQAIEAGLEDSEAGRTVDVQEVRRGFGLC